jgi:hypothetical protein
MRGVSQISPPIRILAIAVLGLIAAWMLVLRPSPDVETPPATTPAATAPGVEGLSNAVDAANGAAAAQEAKDAKVQSATGEATDAAAGTKAAPGSTTSQPAAANAAATKGVLPAPVAKAISDRKVLVLLFWDKDSADDRAVRRELKAVDRWDGEVSVQAAPVKKVSAYARITRGADVSQSPTTLVVDRNLKVTPLVGYVDARSVDQAVLDALRNSGGFLKDPYLADVNELCASVGRVSFAVPDPNNSAEAGGYVSSQKRIFQRLDTRFAAIKAPAKWKGFKRATVADHKAMVSFFADWSAYLGPKPTASRVVASVPRFMPRAKTLSKRYNERMDGQHVLACGSDA